MSHQTGRRRGTIPRPVPASCPAPDPPPAPGRPPGPGPGPRPGRPPGQVAGAGIPPGAGTPLPPGTGTALPPGRFRAAGLHRVSWPAVLALATVLAFAAAFWVVALRGAIGSIAVSQAPFTGWVRDGLASVPLFTLAVLATVPAALGPARRRAGAVRTVLLAAAAATAAGTVLLALQAWTSYRLQAAGLEHSGEMAQACSEACVAAMRAEAAAVQLRGLAVGAAAQLATNLVVVAWVAALRGGRLGLTTAAPRARRTPAPRGAPGLGAVPLGPHPRTGLGGRLRPLPAGPRARRRARPGTGRAVLAALLAGSALIHAAAAPAHWDHWPAAAAFFALLAAAQAGAAVAVLHPAVWPLGAAALVTAVPAAIWAISRTAGMPFGPEAGVPEPVGVADAAATLLGMVAAGVAVVLARRPPAPSPRAPGPPVSRRTVLVWSVAAVAGLGAAAAAAETPGSAGHGGETAPPAEDGDPTRGGGLNTGPRPRSSG